MLGLLFMAKRKERTLEETVGLIQQGNVSLQNELIDSYKPFIAKNVSSVCKRYICETDDEFSIGLIAFHEAIQKYNADKGSSLLSFSEVIIKRRVIDYIRTQAKHHRFSYDYDQDDNEDANSTLDAEISIEDYKKKTDEELRREEIIGFTEILQQFGISFKDLLKISPKHADARKNAMTIALILIENEPLKEFLLEKRKLPIKQLEPYVSTSRKTIERNRKYIIAISLILMSDYVYLKDYVKGVLDT